MASHLVRTTGAWALLLLGLTLPAACLIGPESPLGPCGDVGCDDGNACTDDVCAEDGFCDHVPADSAPDDGNECTIDECAGTEEKHTARPQDDPCGFEGKLQCKSGKCECDTDEECGLTTTCKSFKCESSACASTNAPVGTPVDDAEEDDCKQNECDGEGEPALVPDLTDFAPDPTPGDCKRNGCDAAGPVIVADTDDLPMDDANACTVEACDGDVPVVHEPVDDGTPCGPEPTCEPSGGDFQTVPQPTCQAGTCTPGSPVSCGLFACDPAGDACQSACGDDADCVDAAFCSGSTCASDLMNGAPCAGDSQCTSGDCVDGVCCNSACDGLCEACDGGTPGQCQPVPAGTDPDTECPGAQVCGTNETCVKPVGETCGGDGECLGGHCEDNTCCNEDCSGSCRRCNLSGSVGTCANVPAGQTSGNCAGAAFCDGAGDCKLPLGVPCVNDGMCQSGFCSNEGSSPDVCCDTPCDGLCESCRANKTDGPDGTCSPMTDKTDPDQECSGSCNNQSGMGCCKDNGACY